jgi:hypothetical protein
MKINPKEDPLEFKKKFNWNGTQNMNPGKVKLWFPQ